MTRAQFCHQEVTKGRANGTLVRPSMCSTCGVSCTPVAHHDDYGQPLNVRWLCRSCHAKQHHGPYTARDLKPLKDLWLAYRRRVYIAGRESAEKERQGD
jgi:hypothetical protein